MDLVDEERQKLKINDPQKYDEIQRAQAHDSSESYDEDIEYDDEFDYDEEVDFAQFIADDEDYGEETLRITIQ